MTTAKGRHALAGCGVCGCKKQCFTAKQTGAAWAPYFPDRPSQFNKDVQQLVPRYTGAQDNASFYALLQEQPGSDALDADDPIEGAFYGEELTEAVPPPMWRYEVLRRERARQYVHWIGWPKKYDTWIAR